MDKTFRSWKLGRDSGSLKETIYNHLDYVWSVGVLEHEWAASGGKGDKTIFVYETDQSAKLWLRHRFTGHDSWITALFFLHSGTLMSGSDDASIRLWDVIRGTLLRVLPQDDSITCISSARVDEDNEIVIFGDAQGKLSYLDTKTRETTHLLPKILSGQGKDST